MNPHPAAELLPLMSGPELDALTEDIRAHGLREPIATWPDPKTGEVLLLDGRNRLEACRRAGVEPLFKAYEGDGPTAYVLSLNLSRRHLTVSQRALVAAAALPVLEAEAKERQRGGGREKVRANLPEAGRARDLAAAAADVSPRSVEAAAVVLRSGTPELIKTVREGRAAVSNAVDVARLPIEEQRRRLAGVSEGAVLAFGKEIRAERAKARLEERHARVASAARASEALGKRCFSVLYADPPWSYQHSPSDPRSIEAHYPTLSLSEICGLAVEGRRVSDLAARDAVLFLWTTSPKLREAMSVLDAWGFDYQTAAVWAKRPASEDAKNPWHLGMGYYFRQCHESLLVGTRGDIPTPPTDARPCSVIEAPFGGHSVKPGCVAEIIERMYPTLPRIELFARGRPRAGWTTWGNEIEIAAPAVEAVS